MFGGLSDNAPYLPASLVGLKGLCNALLCNQYQTMLGGREGRRTLCGPGTYLSGCRQAALLLCVVVDPVLAS